MPKITVYQKPTCTTCRQGCSCPSGGADPGDFVMRIEKRMRQGILCAGLEFGTRAQLKAALQEDVGKGDITSEILIPASSRGSAVVIARGKGIFCGRPVLCELFRMADHGLKVRFPLEEGKFFSTHQTVLEIHGRVRSILRVERTALNFLGRLSGIATLTKQFLDRVKPYPVSIMDTRKTTPLWREIEKYAVRVGGGKNHRMGLDDALLVKENHRPYGNLAKLRSCPRRFEIEVRNLREVTEALLLRPRVILCDNFPPALLRQAVRRVRRADRRVVLEASGGVVLSNVRRYAAAGVDRISIGSLTQSVKTLDFSLLLGRRLPA